jgi:radical SAM protein with 4Fe4S-binding SPASM domain
MGKTGVKSIMFAGEGEPLLHKDMPAFVMTAKENGIDVSITTNGSLGSYALWKEILPFLTWIRFSVDAGTADVHATVHKVSEDAFYKTVKSIDEAVRVKRELGLNVTIGIQFLVIKENIDTMEEAVRLFSGIGVDYFSLKPYSLHPQMINKRDTEYTDNLIRHIEEIVDKYKDNSSKMNIIFRKSAMEKYRDKDRIFRHCRALPFWGYISSKGDFYTCSVFINDERFRTGNIYEDDMEHIFFGDKRKQSIKYGEKDLPIAEECRLNCRMARINEFLGFLERRPEHINFI